MPTRSVVVAAAANERPTIGAKSVPTKWSGMNSVE